MSLLDEAIREHLELKRQRGADPTEVARQEHDALSPVERAPRDPQLPAKPVDASKVEQFWNEEAEPEHPAPAYHAPAESPAPPPPAAAPDAGEQTVEWALEDEPEAAPASDVLQDTPDFLQETPEHDRLWFEQKPPRDFDFDG